MKGHRKTRTNAPPERPLVQRSLFEGEDVFVCPFCCEPLARVAGGVFNTIPKACPYCGQPIERNDVKP